MSFKPALFCVLLILLPSVASACGSEGNSPRYALLGWSHHSRWIAYAIWDNEYGSPDRAEIWDIAERRLVRQMNLHAPDDDFVGPRPEVIAALKKSGDNWVGNETTFGRSDNPTERLHTANLGLAEWLSEAGIQPAQVHRWTQWNEPLRDGVTASVRYRPSLQPEEWWITIHDGGRLRMRRREESYGGPPEYPADDARLHRRLPAGQNAVAVDSTLSPDGERLAVVIRWRLWDGAYCHGGAMDELVFVSLREERLSIDP